MKNDRLKHIFLDGNANVILNNGFRLQLFHTRIVLESISRGKDISITDKIEFKLS